VLLEAVLQLATTGLEHSARPLAAQCPGCQQRRGVQSLRKTWGTDTRRSDSIEAVVAPLLAMRSWLERT
jgi:hypothetical protein